MNKFLIVIDGVPSLEGDDRKEVLFIAENASKENKGIVQVYDVSKGSPGKEIFHSLSASLMNERLEKFEREFNAWFAESFLS